MTRAPRIAAVVLAAGAGSRMGGPKAELVVRGERLVDRAVRICTAAGCARVLVIVREGTAVPGAELVVNAEPGRGLRSSLELGVAAAGDVDAVAVALVDLPGLTSAGVAAVLGAWRPGRIAVARYGDRRGHPTVMSRQSWRAALARAGPDEGARAYLRTVPDLVDEMAVTGSPDDLDTPQDLARWRRG